MNADGLVTPARRVARSILVARARDETPGGGRPAARLVVVAPHPDDETIGCGALLARRAADGAPVTVVVVSDGSRSHTSPSITPTELARIRRDEATAAVAALGRNIDLLFLDFPDGELAAHSGELGQQLEKILRAAGPCEVLSPSVHEPPTDHSSVGEAVRAAWRAVAAQTPDPHQRLLEYPVWLWSRWPLSSGVTSGESRNPLHAIFRRPVVKVSTAGHLSAKRAAMQAYVTQMTNFRGDPTWSPLPSSLVRRALGPYELYFPVER